jgi:hypothetical protein
VILVQKFRSRVLGCRSRGFRNIIVLPVACGLKTYTEALSGGMSSSCQLRGVGRLRAVYLGVQGLSIEEYRRSYFPHPRCWHLVVRFNATRHANFVSFAWRFGRALKVVLDKPIACLL